MGVKSLLDYLRKQCEEIVQKGELTELKGQRVAIDIATVNYAYKSRYISKVAPKLNLLLEDIDYGKCTVYMFKEILHLLNQVLIAAICPVMVFDGTAPALKDGTKRDRAGKSDKKKRKIAMLRRIGNALVAGNYVPQEGDLEFLRSFKTPITTLDLLRDRLLIEIKSFIVISRDDQLKLQAIFSAIGVPYVVAESEAEKTCSLMAKRKDVAAVYTTDSDCLMYGCPIMISKLTYGVTARIPVPPKMEVYSFTNVLAVTGLTETQFMQFCIMCGTDFNDNSPGFGPKSNHDLLLTFGSIPKIREAKQLLQDALDIQPWLKLGPIEKLLVGFNPDVLHYEEVRHFLTYPETYDRNALNIRISDRQFETCSKTLNEILTQEVFAQLLDLCKKIIEKLKGVAAIMKQ